MQVKGSIRAVNFVIRDFCTSINSTGLESPTARLAQARFAEKFEVPDSETKNQRRTDAWSRWITADNNLPKGIILGPHWAEARLRVHAVLANFKLGDLAFTNGSNFEPVRNRTSIACKLEDAWTITPDCFDIFARYSFWHRALKHSVKKRFISYCTSKRIDIRDANRKLWVAFKNKPECAFEIYKFKLHCIVTFVNGNRWSTVPKNNIKDRSICLEPMCNMLVQRAVGLGVRKCLKDTLGIDLDHLADVHRNRISSEELATIDLSDCSDTISTWLTKYLFPSRVFNKISACRSDMTLGLDGEYYITNKVSSMGNGFTFDVMSLILTALTRCFDEKATVFGDDIVCHRFAAKSIIDTLSIAGFCVNLKKTNVDSGYRESCGAHFVDGYGYLTSFDMKWLKNPHDLVVACNKVAILSAAHGGVFTKLQQEIWKCVPKPLLGATVGRPTIHTGKPPSYELDTYIRYGPLQHNEPNKHMCKVIRSFCKCTCKTGRISVAVSFTNTSKQPKSTLRSSDWPLYLQYLAGGRRSLKIPVSVFKSALVARVGEEQIGFARALLP